MEILNNFSMIYCFIAFVIGAVFMLAILSIAAIGKEKKPSNKVHFYVARDKDGSLWLYIGKPFRCNNSFNASLNSLFTFPHYTFHRFGINKNDYSNLKWEDEPIEVFVNIEE